MAELVPAIHKRKGSKGNRDDGLSGTVCSAERRGEPMKFRVLAALGASALVVSCGREPPAAPLQSAPDAAYSVFVRTYDDGHGDQPFELLISSRRPGAELSSVLFADQCKDVDVAQTPAFLYIFYGELGLKSFGSFAYDGLPRPVLCDLQTSHCSAFRTQLKQQGYQLQKVCTFSTDERQ
jgi:hypothetical protein